MSLDAGCTTCGKSDPPPTWDRAVHEFRCGEHHSEGERKTVGRPADLPDVAPPLKRSFAFVGAVVAVALVAGYSVFRLLTPSDPSDLTARANDTAVTLAGYFAAGFPQAGDTEDAALSRFVEQTVAIQQHLGGFAIDTGCAIFFAEGSAPTEQAEDLLTEVQTSKAGYLASGEFDAVGAGWVEANGRTFAVVVRVKCP